MADDKEPDPFSHVPPTDALGDGATRMFSLKMESWLTDIAADIEAEAPPPAAGAPAAGPPPAAPAPIAPAAYVPAIVEPPPHAMDHAAHAPAMGADAAHSSPRPLSSPDLGAHALPAPLHPPAHAPMDAAEARASSHDLAAQAAPVASAVPPIPSITTSAVPPIPALAGAGPAFEPKPRGWVMALGIVAALLVGGGAAAWLFMGAKIRALLGL